MDHQTMTSIPLPPIDPSRFESNDDAVVAYKLLLDAEAQAVLDRVTEKIVHVRVIGYLFLEFYHRRGPLGNKPFETIILEIKSPPTNPNDTRNDVIFELGKLHQNRTLRALKTVTKRYSPPSSHPSRPAYDSMVEEIKTTMEASGKGYQATRRQAIARDGFRCLVTGLFNRESVKGNLGVQKLHKDLGGPLVSLQACHILNESLTQGTGLPQTHNAAGVVPTLLLFGLEELAIDLQIKDRIHETWNLLSLSSQIHEWFDRLELWFEELPDVPNHYKVCCSDGAIEEFVRLTSKRPETSGSDASMVLDLGPRYKEAPPPSRQLLALHAACARVVHTSGAADFLDKLESDAEKIAVLASDGSSASLLGDLLSVYAIVPGVA